MSCHDLSLSNIMFRSHTCILDHSCSLAHTDTQSSHRRDCRHISPCSSSPRCTCNSLLCIHWKAESTCRILHKSSSFLCNRHTFHLGCRRIWKLLWQKQQSSTLIENITGFLNWDILLVPAISDIFAGWRKESFSENRRRWGWVFSAERNKWRLDASFYCETIETCARE